MVRQAGLPEMTPWFGGRQEEAVRCISFSRETHADHLADRILGDVRKIRLPLFLVVVRGACVLEILCEANTQDAFLNLNAPPRTFCVGPRSA